MSKLDILLIYPQLGSWDNFVRDIPLSLIYTATHSVKAGFNVKIIDLRTTGKNWQEVIDREMNNGCSLVGISVMTGNPIMTSLKISKYIKEKYDTLVVWGGPHPTILPEQTLENPYIDYVIRDWGSKALSQLTEFINGGSINREKILGLGYKEDGHLRLNPAQSCFELLDFKDLPYHLVDISKEKYNRMRNGELIFPIYTSIGCPYKCNFCMSPSVYQKIKGKKWIAYTVEYIIEHIEYLSQKYSFDRLQIYDDDSFVDLDRIYNFLVEYIRKGFNKKYILDFRGARINELDKMDDDYLRLMVEARVNMMFIGMESGSQRVLKMMNKGISTNQIVRVNKKLANYPELKPHYNFFCGIPGEQMEDLILTKEMVIRLVNDNPYCYLGRAGHWKPIPGSVLTDIAVKNYGLQLPSNLADWAAIDTRDADPMEHPWYTPKMKKFIDLLKIVGIVLDRKAEDLTGNLGPILGKVFYLLGMLYRPILRLRLKYNFTGFFIENEIVDLFIRNIGKLLKHN